MKFLAPCQPPAIIGGMRKLDEIEIQELGTNPSYEERLTWWQERRSSLRDRDGDMCPMCEQPMLFERPEGMGDRSWFKNMATIDHIVARSEGGTNALDNLVLMHGKCNRKKGSGGETRNAKICQVIFPELRRHGIGIQGIKLKDLIKISLELGIVQAGNLP